MKTEPCDCPRAFTTYAQCPHTGSDAFHHIDCPVFKTGECNCKAPPPTGKERSNG